MPPFVCTTFILVKRQEKEQERTRKRKIRGPMGRPVAGVGRPVAAVGGP